MAKFHVKNYSKSTPVIFRKIGDSILIMGTTLTATFAGMEVSKEWIIGVAIFTGMGKVFTNFFTDEEVVNIQNSNNVNNGQ